MQQKFDPPAQRPRGHRPGLARLPLLAYFACLPLFFSASALSWPFSEPGETTSPTVRDWPTSRDCAIAPSQSDENEQQETVEDEEPDCD